MSWITDLATIALRIIPEVEDEVDGGGDQVTSETELYKVIMDSGFAITAEAIATTIAASAP